jgi:N utilization substance protein A
VASKDPKVDPVGACVGMRGIRVKNIVRELSGEKIDIIRWTDDIRAYVTNALSPAKVAKIWIDENIPQMVHVTCDADQLSLAIGKRGQNVRLTARLVGWKIDIQRDESNISFEEKVSMAVGRLAAVPGIGRERAETLVKAGYLTVDGILAAETADIAEATGLSVEDAAALHEAAAAAQEIKEPAE